MIVVIRARKRFVIDTFTIGRRMRLVWWRRRCGSGRATVEWRG
jgi:hypothetical protein